MAISNFSIISFLAIIPMLSIFMLALISPYHIKAQPQLINNVHYTTIWTAFIILLFSGFIIIFFDFQVLTFQFTETKFIIFGTPYKLGIDGISLFFILLSSLVFLHVTLIISHKEILDTYYTCILLLIMQTVSIILFISLNLLAILFFLEVSLFCLYMLLSDKDIGISSNELWQIFLLLVSADMLTWVAIAYIYSQTGLINLDELILHNFSQIEQFFLWGMLFITILIRLGLLPWHRSWLYFCKQRTAMIFCIIMSNAILYLVFRLNITLFPYVTDSTITYIAISLLILSLLNNFLTSLNFLQKMKFSHLPLLILSILLGKDGILGAIFYLIGYNLIHLSFVIFACASQLPSQQFKSIDRQAFLGLTTYNSELEGLVSTNSLYTLQKYVLIALISIASGFLPTIYLIGYLIILQSLFEISGLMFILGLLVGVLPLINHLLVYQYLLDYQLSLLELVVILTLLGLAVCLGFFPNVIINLFISSFMFHP